MNHTRFVAWLLVSTLPVFLCGCIVCELRVTNRTGGAIQFYTGHTKKVIKVAAGAAATIPHSSGKVIVITEQDEVWEYGMVHIGDFEEDTAKGFKRLTLPLVVEASGTIVLPSGKKFHPTPKAKPRP